MLHKCMSNLINETKLTYSHINKDDNIHINYKIINMFNYCSQKRDFLGMKLTGKLSDNN